MRNALTVGLVIGTLTLVPAAGFAQAQTYGSAGFTARISRST